MLGRVVRGLEQDDPRGEPIRLVIPRSLEDPLGGGPPRHLDEALAGEAKVLPDPVDAGEGLVVLEPMLRSGLPVGQRPDIATLRAGEVDEDLADAPVRPEDIGLELLVAQRPTGVDHLGVRPQVVAEELDEDRPRRHGSRIPAPYGTIDEA